MRVIPKSEKSSLQRPHVLDWAVPVLTIVGEFYPNGLPFPHMDDSDPFVTGPTDWELIDAVRRIV